MNKYKKEEEKGEGEGGGGGGGGERHKQLLNWNSFEPVFFVALWTGLKRQKTSRYEFCYFFDYY